MLQTLRLKCHMVMLKHQKEVETQAKQKYSAKQHLRKKDSHLQLRKTLV